MIRPEETTICIPCFNSEKYIERALDSVVAQDTSPSRIICIDGGSTDRTPTIIQSHRCGELVQHETNRGVAEARNTGLQMTETKGLVMIDADQIVEPDFLSQLCLAMNRYEADAVCGRVTEKISNLPDKYRSAHLQLHFGDHPRRLDRILGGQTLWRVSALRDVGGWDGDLRRAYEDTEISNRLTNAGYTLWYTPDAQARHLRTDNIKTVLDRRWEWLHYADRPTTLRDVLTNVPGYVLRAAYEAYWDIQHDRAELLLLHLLMPAVFFLNDIDKRKGSFPPLN